MSILHLDASLQENKKYREEEDADIEEWNTRMGFFHALLAAEMENERLGRIKPDKLSEERRILKVWSDLHVGQYIFMLTAGSLSAVVDRPLPGELPQPVTQRSIVLPVGLVAVGSTAQVHQDTGLSRAKPKTADNMGDRLSFRLGL